jgi:hypothetical protein
MRRTIGLFPGIILAPGREAVMITTSFDPRTFANMEVALQRACDQLPEDRNGHAYRRYVAQCIVDCATNESQSLTSLSHAGFRAVIEVCAGGDHSGGKMSKRLLAHGN